MSERLVLLGIITIACSGMPGLFFKPGSLGGQRLANLLTVLGGVLGLCGVGVFWLPGDSEPIALSWSVPGVEFVVEVDGISAIFLVPVCLISVLGSIYGLGYWKETDHPDNGRKLRLFYGLLTASMALLVIARNAILFLVAWEIMALSAFFLITTEDDQKPVREAGWIYLVATHLGTLCLFALFALWRSASGSFALVPLAEGKAAPAVATAMFILAIAGFGLKAGIMPLHVWLPGAHAAAPSHVSALLSGVLIKMGVYGIVRFTSLLPAPPPWWGGTLLFLGVVSGVLGVAFAIGQHDLKQLLAYHSIENIGIIVMGLGLALVGRSLGRADWIILGLAGSLLHVWNHALFKALLFLGAGSVVHAVGTREIDRLDGLSRAMPRTSLCFLVGAVAICGLPPLNGFVSEFLIYLGLFGTLGGSGGTSFAGAAFAAPALALVGALAVACFVKVFGVVFLGTPRSVDARRAHEAGPAMIAPMAVLVACCIFIGLASPLIAPVLGEAIAEWAPEVQNAVPPLTALAPLGSITVMNLVLLAGLALAAGFLWRRLRQGAVETGPTWGCGYVAPSPRMQYTSSSFAQMLVGLFGWALRPKTHAPKNLPLFPGPTDFHSHLPDPMLDEAVLPTFRFGARVFSRLRVFQQGSIQMYLLYIFLALLALLLWR
jgi:hydrogenase-4 component B